MEVLCSAELSFLHYFHSAISNHLFIAISMSLEWIVAITGLTVYTVEGSRDYTCADDRTY